MSIFLRDRYYTLKEIISICDANKLITVDCLKDEDIISVEEKGADCLFEFKKISDDLLKLTWVEKI